MRVQVVVGVFLVIVGVAIQVFPGFSYTTNVQGVRYNYSTYPALSDAYIVK